MFCLHFYGISPASRVFLDKFHSPTIWWLLDIIQNKGYTQQLYIVSHPYNIPINPSKIQFFYPFNPQKPYKPLKIRIISL